MTRTTEAETFWDREAETMPRRDLEQLQASRLRSCLERLQAADIGYYKERLSGVRSDQIRSAEDLERLPFMVKDDFREHYPFGLFLVPLNEIVRIHASSGSTGQPTVVGYTRSDLELWADVLARGLAAGRVSKDDVFQNAYGHGLFTGGLGFHDAVTRVGAAVVPTSAGNTSRQVMLMRDFGVTAFGATPSYALHIAEVAVEEGVDLPSLPVRAAFLGAESMSEEMEREIEARAGVTVYEQYGLSEIIGPGVASACGRSEGMHVWEDYFIPEVVDPESGERLPDGEVGELVLTAPTKEALPIIRYRTRDLTRLTREPCPCGRTGGRISRIRGRTDDMLIIRGVNVFPSQIEHALLGIDGLEPHYQLVLGTREDHQDALSVRVEMAEDVAEEPHTHEALEARVSGTLQEALSLTATVELAPPQTIPRSEGKAVRVLDQRTSGR
ncbi:MAG: phenylacetate--CoA ligase [Actinomycetota bacterium]|nr:phenylacetate--CoA ligase [Actinomycetota bacterium]